ncbi:MAG: hypothetical protein KC492_09125, partial [Myxococcales bacterium]|nr:hypothetical protein [Myxococcales bacterium]
MKDAGLQWYEYMQFTRSLVFCPLQVTFANVATHNHFCLVRGRHVFNSKAPVIKLPAGASEEDHLALLGLLNSSVACFWMKQVFHPKSHASQRHHPDPARAAYEFAATGLLAFPLPELGGLHDRMSRLAGEVDSCAQQRGRLLDAEFVNQAIRESQDALGLASRMEKRWRDADVLRERMVGMQEELDWVAYVGFGLAPIDGLIEPERYVQLSCPRGERPFERIAGRSSTVRSGGRALSQEEGEVPAVGALPEWAEETWKRRELLISESDALQLIETAVFKRAWRDSEQNVAEPEYRKRKDEDDLRTWLA